MILLLEKYMSWSFLVDVATMPTSGNVAGATTSKYGWLSAEGILTGTATNPSPRETFSVLPPVTGNATDVYLCVSGIVMMTVMG